MNPDHGADEPADASPASEASRQVARAYWGHLGCNRVNTNQISRIAGLVGEPARTAMLMALMDGRGLTASELARAAGITPPTASSHLAKLVDAELLRRSASGRHRYFRLASPDVAKLLESLMQLAAKASAAAPPRVVVGPKDAALRAARTCYDHLAGRLGVAITQRLVSDGGLVLEEESAYLTDAGRRALGRLGIEAPIDATAKQRPSATSCRPCLDWSERRFHISGRLATRICSHCFDSGWLLRRQGSRAVALTPAGQGEMQNWLGMELWQGLGA